MHGSRNGHSGCTTCKWCQLAWQGPWDADPGTASPQLAVDLLECLKGAPAAESLLVQCKQLVEFPRCVLSLATSLTKLTIKQCYQLEVLPDAIGQLTSLKQLSIDTADLQALPYTIGCLRSMRELHLNCLPVQFIPERCAPVDQLLSSHWLARP